MKPEYLGIFIVVVLLLLGLWKLYLTSLTSEFEHGYNIGKLIAADSVKLSGMRHAAKLTIEQVSLDTGLELELIHCIETADYLRIKPLDYAHIVQTLYTYYYSRRLGKCAGSCAASDTCPKNDLYTIQEPIGTSA